MKAPTDEAQKRVKLTLWVPRELAEWFRTYCEETGAAQSRLVTIFIRDFRGTVSAGD